MAKIHMAANKGTNGQEIYARCAAKSIGNGKVRRNNRSKYQFMASEIVSYNDFRNVPAEDRCAHCMDMGLEARNKQRKAAGKPPVNHLFAEG